MNVLKIIAAIATLAAALHYWTERQEQNAIRAATDMHGFLPVPMPPGADANTVMIFAPANCPRENAKRARAISEQLTQRGIPNVLTSSYPPLTFQPGPEMDAAIKRLNVVMTGEIPIALVNGMGKSNVTLEEVVAEYNRTK